MLLDFLLNLGIFFAGSVLIDGFIFLSNISDYSDYLTGCFNDIINYFSGFFRGTPPVEVDVIINGENILENGNLENSNLMYGNENLMLENQDTINLIYGNENLTLENQDTVNLTVENQDTVNLTVEDQENVNLTVENQDTVNLTVEDQENVNLTVENQDTVNLTVEDQENVNLTVENQDTVNLTVENQDTENSVISSLINKGGKVYDDSATLRFYNHLVNSYVDTTPYSNISHIRHHLTSILSKESIGLKIVELKTKSPRLVRLPDFYSFKGFPEARSQAIIEAIYLNKRKDYACLCGIFANGTYNHLGGYLFHKHETLEFTFTDENTVKYVKENLDIFKAYTHLPFRLGLLHELSVLAQGKLGSGDLRDVKGHLALFHTLDVCTALYQSIEEIPEVSIRNFGDLYKNDKDFKWQVDFVNNNDRMNSLVNKIGSLTNQMSISYSAEVLNCILDKVYKKNNGTDNN